MRKISTLYVEYNSELNSVYDNKQRLGFFRLAGSANPQIQRVRSSLVRIRIVSKILLS